MGNKIVLEELKHVILKNENFDEIVEDELIPKYGWEIVEKALFDILLDDASSEKEYSAVADIFWSAVLSKEKIDKEKTVGLLYYRLGDINAPYENNTIWSISSELYNLDYADSEFNPLKDKKILDELAEYDIYIK